ncbi:flagellar protein FlaJ [Methanofollis sp. W23]|uniref:type II secretion system F family protein n=1 Tax=Methanofollis sp. W23 TaxID=2817849 RepID=UPI001AE982E2|nr:type II secretion system F family protein [Methanofollis sp. W23]MBP2146347.1 flagellar protein FlaJ [Methanofollis sp. W23]
MKSQGATTQYRACVRRLISRDEVKYGDLGRALVSARLGMTVERYVGRALGVAIFSGLFAALVAYLAAGLVALPPSTGDALSLPLPLPEFGAFTLLLRPLLSLLLGLAAGYASYTLLLRYPRIEMKNRAAKIDLSLHNAVSYLYAMRRGGAELMEIFRSISANAGVYGESALEFRQVVRDADYFGADVVTALQGLSLTTPSEKLREFLDDFISVIESGGNLSAYLSGRVKIYQEEAGFEQKKFLSSLELIGEAYVTVFVAGPLFLVIVMVVTGLIGGAAVTQLSVLTYLLVPLGSVIILLFLDLVSVKEEAPERYTAVKILDTFKDVRTAKPNSDEETGFAQLARYERYRRLKIFLRNPLRSFVLEPRLTFLITVPAAAVYLCAILFTLPPRLPSGTAVTLVDDHLALAALLLLVPYALCYEAWARRVRGIEAAVPDFLARMAGINQVGLTIAQAIEIMVRTNLGLLSYEIRRVSRDLTWGANVEDALVRFERRVRTPAVSRSVSLIAAACRMSGEISEVLSIAAKDARMSHVLAGERKAGMALYIIVIYLAYVVFLFVVVVISTRFLPVLGEISVPSTGAGTSFLPGRGASSVVPTFDRLLFHLSLVQAFFSGLVAGKMGEGSVKAGVKHATVMLAVALVTFAFVV